MLKIYLDLYEDIIVSWRLRGLVFRPQNMDKTTFPLSFLVCYTLKKENFPVDQTELTQLLVHEPILVLTYESRTYFLSSSTLMSLGPPVGLVFNNPFFPSSFRFSIFGSQFRFLFSVLSYVPSFSGHWNYSFKLD